MKGEVQRNVDSIVQKYTETAKQDDTKIEGNLTSKPYLGGARVEYTSGSSMGVPPGLRLLGGARELGSREEQEPKGP